MKPEKEKQPKDEKETKQFKEEIEQKKQKKEENETKEALTMTAILQSQLQDTVQQLTEFKNKYLTALADSENMRKRLQKEKQEYIDFAKRDLLRDILIPLDQFENALKHAKNMSNEVKNWAFGFQMILEQMREILKQNKVTSFESIGHPFNSTLHEAIEIIETSDAKPGIILEEYAKGYMIGDYVLRPAKVKVAKEKIEKEVNNKD